MRLYLSSYRLGNQPQALLDLLPARRRTALIFNAGDLKLAAERKQSVDRDLAELTALGLDPFEVDLRDYFENSAGLREILATVDLIWARGGNCFVLRRALLQSGADELIKDMLGHDAVVYGGFSAGCDMLIPSLHGAELCDDPNAIPPGYLPAIIWDGLGLLPYSIAPHYRSDHPESAAIDKSVEYMIDHHIPFIALRDGQAIVVNGATQTITG